VLLRTNIEDDVPFKGEWIVNVNVNVLLCV
jgi:hypothetical protein